MRLVALAVIVLVAVVGIAFLFSKGRVEKRIVSLAITTVRRLDV